MLIFENLDSHWTQAQLGRVKLAKQAAWLQKLSNNLHIPIA